MSDNQLARRFLADWPSPFSPEGELVYSGPRRQKELISIGHQQLEAQRAAAKTISRSNIAAAQIIAAEISQQTAALETSLREYSNGISSSITDAADQISTALDVLGDRLCVYLGEIRWELAQQSSMLAGILHTLRESRSNEARQLVEQGVRHYANEQFERAEERFRQALRQDTTDYQVLMNLGLVSVHKGQNREAQEYFHDALRLPAGLDKSAKNRALLALARLHFAGGDYGKALEAARQAAAIADASQVSDVFLLGTYAALAGDLNDSLLRIEEAIRQQPAFFVRAAIEPNLEAHRPAVLELLSRLSAELLTNVTNGLATVETLLVKANQHDQWAGCAAEREAASRLIQALTRRVSRASYSDLLQILTDTSQVSQALEAIHKAEDLANDARSVERSIQDLEVADDSAKRELDALGEHFHGFRIRFWALWHLVTYFTIGPVVFAQSTRSQRNILTAYFFVGFPLWALLQYLTHVSAERLEKRHQAERSKRYRTKSVAGNALDAARAQIAALRKRSAELLAKAMMVLSPIRPE